MGNGVMAGRDQNFETFLGRLLRTGVVLAAIIVFTGGVWFLAQSSGAARHDYAVFHGEPAEMSHVTQIVRGAIAWQPLAIIQFGMLVLIATPVARVLFSMLGFALERDWMYVGVTIVVLAVLLYSLSNSSGR
jgi:uncharacterized membrane protein